MYIYIYIENITKWFRAHETLTVTKHHLERVILFTVNYCLFANGGVSIRFNGKDGNVVLESIFV